MEEAEASKNPGCSANPPVADYFALGIASQRNTQRDCAQSAQQHENEETSPGLR